MNLERTIDNIPELSHYFMSSSERCQLSAYASFLGMFGDLLGIELPDKHTQDALAVGTVVMAAIKELKARAKSGALGIALSFEAIKDISEDHYFNVFDWQPTRGRCPRINHLLEESKTKPWFATFTAEMENSIYDSLLANINANSD